MNYQKRQKTEIRQIQIKKAVLEIIAKEGIGKLSTRNLASKIGVTEAALFRHFPSKISIIQSIIEDVKSELISKQEKITNSKRLTPQKKICDFFNFHLKYLVENNGITILLFTEATHFNEPKLKSEMKSIFSRQKELLIEILDQGMKKGIWDDTLDKERLALLYLGIPLSLNMDMVLEPKIQNFNKFCEKMLTIIFKILEK